MTSVTFQILNISLLTVVCFMLIQANPHSEYFKTCNDEIKNLNPAPSTRRPCIMACVGVKEGWFLADYSMNVTKKLEVAKNMFSNHPDKLAAFTTAINACKDAAKGSSDYCSAGSKMHDCMKSNNAPFPGHGPPQ